MPLPLGTSVNGDRVPSITERLLHIAAQADHGTDEIDIGSPQMTGTSGWGCVTMRDARKVVSSVKWLVKGGWVPYGMITGIIGEPGTGKSALALWIAKTVATGGKWFNGHSGPKPSNVLWCPTESDLAITLLRMDQWEVPDDKLILPGADDPLQSIDLLDESHMLRMEAIITEFKTPLVVVDSLRGGHKLDENSSQVSAVLNNLAAIAQRTSAAVIVVHHTKKLMEDEEITSNSSRGSNSIIALMRSQIGIDRPGGKDSEWARMRILKRHFEHNPKGIGFKFVPTGLEFGPAPTKPQKERRESGAEKAEAWLIKRMEVGQWYDASTLQDEAEAVGFSPTGTLQKAREALGVTQGAGNVERKGKRWMWRRQA